MGRVCVPQPQDRGTKGCPGDCSPVELVSDSPLLHLIVGPPWQASALNASLLILGDEVESLKNKYVSVLCVQYACE